MLKFTWTVIYNKDITQWPKNLMKAQKESGLDLQLYDMKLLLLPQLSVERMLDGHLDNIWELGRGDNEDPTRLSDV